MSNWVDLGNGKEVRGTDQRTKEMVRVRDIEQAINENLGKAVYEVNSIFHADQRFNEKMSAILKAGYEIITATMKAIPIGGGYVGLIKKVLKNPLIGGHEVLRSTYGGGWEDNDGAAGGWSIFGSAANGVSSPLTLGGGVKGYNLATGNPTLFQQDQRMKYEQMELEMMNAIGVAANIPGIDQLFKGQANAPHAATALREMSKMRREVAEIVNVEYAQNPRWFFIDALAGVSIADVACKDGMQDLASGVLDSDDGLSWDVTRMQALIRRDAVKMTGRSRMHGVIKGYKKNIGFLDSTIKGYGLTISSSQLRRMEVVKAKYVAYRKELTTDSLFSTVAADDIKRRLNAENSAFFHVPSDESEFAPRLCSSLSLVVELFIAAFGSSRVSQLPPSKDSVREVLWVLADAAECGGAFMSNGNKNKALWVKWFYELFINHPDTRALFLQYDKVARESIGNGNRTQAKFPTIGELRKDLNRIQVLGFQEFGNYTGQGILDKAESLLKGQRDILRSFTPGEKTIWEASTIVLPKFQEFIYHPRHTEYLHACSEQHRKLHTARLDNFESTADKSTSVGLNPVIRQDWIVFSDRIKKLAVETRALDPQDAIKSLTEGLLSLHMVVRNILDQVGLRNTVRESGTARTDSPSLPVYNSGRNRQEGVSRTNIRDKYGVRSLNIDM